MLDGWKRAAVLAAAVLALALYTAWRSVPEKSEIDRLETRLADYSIKTLGGEPQPLARYARRYALIRPSKAKDLPFTTLPASLGEAPHKRLIAGVLTLAEPGQDPPAGIRRVARRELPVVVRGGCRTVNVLYDPSEDAMIDVWCNMPDRRPASPAAAQAPRG